MKKKILLILVLIITMMLSFYKNIFISDSKSKASFDSFQLDSESLVIGRIARDKYKLNDNPYGLQKVKTDENILSTNHLLNNSQNSETIDYKSQFGLQGTIFSFLYNKLHISINGLHLICSFILAIVLVSICYLLKEKYGKLFAIIFYIVFLLSPWVVHFGKNLYWVEFTWFLPLLFCLLLSKTKNFKIYIPLIFLAVLFKCLCGYEYLSTILLTSISFLLTDFVLDKDKRKEIFKTILYISVASILAFIVALCMHSILRGEGNIFHGINTIIREDVMRRTIATDSNLFDDELIKSAINSSYFSVIKKYFNFSSDIIYGIDGSLFIILFIFSLYISIYNYYKNKDLSKRDLVLYIVFLISTLSWFVLGKAHSYSHTHINFVLWYFGFIQISLYIVVKFFIRFINEYKENL